MTANRITGKRRGNSGRGFTLVELIVVIVIIAVLATVGFVTVFGYIKKSRFEQNSQSAVSVYQGAQTALSMKVANGTNDSWTKKLVEMKLNEDQIKALTKDLDTDNESHSTVIALTFNPKSSSAAEDSYLYNLLNDQFYDKTLFNGTMSVEFNVVASYAKGRIYYSSWVASAFYCLQNDSDSGWNEVCIHDSEDGLPQREPYEYRRDTSLVGWYNGTPDSVTGPDGVCPVHIPKTIITDLDGHIIADSTDTGYLFNLRNAETLDVSWAIFDYDETSRSISDLSVHDEDITINLITEGTAFGNSESYSNIELYLSQTSLEAFRGAALNSTEITTYENINGKPIVRATRAATVDVQVKRGDSTLGTWKFPMTISKVTGDDRTGCPDKDIGYYEYRLSLDCMMNRDSEKNGVTTRFNVDRLFGTTPRNISATLTATFTHYVAKEQTESKSVIDVKAARAIDDPVYYTGVSQIQGNTSYCYAVIENAAAYDGADDVEENTTGKCVVNTLFGDLRYSDTLAATSWSGSGDSAVGNAVITSFRHLYNIRWIQSGTVKYSIVRDLNWYINQPGVALVSDVKVFKADGKYNSPSDNVSNNLYIVSFPALNELKANQTLTSASSAGKTFTINNLQMRTASFINKTDEGYGLICKNSGTVSNIYTNNFNLILANIPDGSNSDYSSVSKGEVEIKTWSLQTLENTYYVGGLVGLNLGSVGEPNVQESENTVMMSNAIIMSCSQTDNYWGTGTYPGVSAVVGKNTGTLSGKVEINGNFAVMGNGDVGAAIAYTESNIGARIVVDGTNHGRSEFTLPKESTTGSNSNLSCIIAGTTNVGGAIGYMKSCELNYDVKKFSDSNVYYNSDTGAVTFDDWDATDYQIYINLPEDSLILELDKGTVGGAIGYMDSCNGVFNYMSIRVKNLGNTLIRNKDTSINEVGGAIGQDKNSTISTAYIYVYNGDGALGSRLNANNSPLNNVEHGGGVYGLLETTNGRTIYMDVENAGTKISATSDNNGDNQGAGGAIGALKSGNIKIVANVVNMTGSKFVYYSNAYNKNNGVGGAIGTIEDNSGNTYLTAESHIFVKNSGYIHANYNVGGAVGVMNVNHGDIYAYNDGAEITGSYCVGGAVGWSKKVEDGDIQSVLSGTTISGTNFIGGAAGRIVDFRGATVATKVFDASTVSGTGSVIGGVCGDIRIQGDGTGSIKLDGNGSKLTVSASGDGVGGVAGLIRSSIVNYVTVRADNVILNVSGKSAVGGAIGRLRSTTWEDTTNANANTSNALTGNKSNTNMMVDISVVLPHASTIVGKDENVGGAVGFVHTNACKFGGSISVKSKSGDSEGDSLIRGKRYVGGAIGHIGSISPDRVNENSGISVDFRDSPFAIEATIDAASDANLGGAVGFFDGDGKTGYDNNEFVIDAKLGNTSISASGSNVGGGIGYNMLKNGIINVTFSGTISGNKNVGGGIGNNGANSVTSISAVIETDGCISGSKNLGGAVGSLGSASIATTIGTVSAEINTGIPIVQTEAVSKTDNACIGGVIGLIVKGTISKIELSGNGGEINPQTDVQGSGAPYYPISDGILISGSGRGLGGIIGLIGDSTAERYTKIIDISVSDNGPSIAVVSDNGSQGIGGWIGTCYSKADIGNSKTSLSKLTIKTVKVAYSRGECVGGFIGYVGKTPTNAANKVELYVNIDMELSSAYICGLARTGGVYGDSNCVNHYGKCNLDICNNTSIGDYKGDIETDDLSGCFCIEAGGFAGRFSNRSIFYGSNDKALCEITITIDETSRIFAGGTSAPSDCEVTIDDAGVGGAIGRLGGDKGGNSDISVTNTTAEKIQDHFVKTFGVIASSSKPVVYSAHSHAGGAIGHMLSGCLARAFTTACVKQVGSGYTGGFVGKMDEGSIRNCYVGGHTFGGQYVPDEENIVGTQYVGGFVGYVTKNISIIYQSYSTASVRSTYTGGKNVYLGGFIGGSDPALTAEKFQYTYCTGLVTAPNNLYTDGIIPSDGSVYVGAYAGYLSSLNICKSGEASGRALMYINQYSEMGRVGNYDEKSFYDGEFVASTDPNKEAGVKNRNDNSKHVLLARWGSWGPNWYIRHKKLSVYEAQPFDTYLVENSDNYFPLRTFISYITPNVSNSWTGEHWGDWPVFPEDKIMLDKDNTVITINMPQEGFVFNGSQVTLEDYLKVKYNGQELDLDTDYALKYSDNDKIGTATVRITAIGRYYGSFVRQFEIKKADISNQNAFSIEVTNATPYLDGAEVKPPVKIVYKLTDNDNDNDNVTLVENKDYTLLYESNLNPGTAKVTITGIGNYTGEVVKEFRILPLYDIFFSTGEGTTIPQQRIFEGGLAVRPKDDPTRTGHTFAGWYADDKYQTEYDFSIPVMSDITIYAKWTADKYEVTFEDNGGVAVEPILVEYGEKIDTTLIPEQSKENHTFVGWYLDELCTEEYDFDTVVTGALKLYARWEKKPTVTFDAMGGNFSITDKTYDYNDAVDEPEEKPTLEGYTFLGWCSDEECNNDYDFDTKLTADITLYAKWAKNPTVTFVIDGNIGAENRVDKQIPYNTNLTEEITKLSIPVIDGWIPYKWYSDLDSNTEYDLSTNVTEDITIYLGWLKTWKITVHTGEGGTVYGKDGTIEVVHGKLLTLDPEVPVRDGFVFDGWYTDPYYTNPVDVKTMYVTCNDDIYAKWIEDPATT